MMALRSTRQLIRRLGPFGWARLCWSDAAADAVEFDYHHGDAAYAHTRRLRRTAHSAKPLVLHPKDTSLSFGALQDCVVAVRKPALTLTYELIDQARAAMGARHYCIGHAGALPVMESGLILLLFGAAAKKMAHYVDMDREYTGTMRIGQTTATYDVLSPILELRPWAHLRDEVVECEARKIEGKTLQLRPPYLLGKATKKEVLCHLRRLSDKDREKRPMRVQKFSLARKTPASPDFEFHVVCCTKLTVSCLIQRLGERLGCGAHVRFAERIRVGDFTLEDAWDVEPLMEHIASLRRTAFLKDFGLYDQMKHMYWRSLGPKTNKKKKRIKRQWEKRRKERQLIRAGLKEPIQTALCY